MRQLHLHQLTPQIMRVAVVDFDIDKLPDLQRRFSVINIHQSIDFRRIGGGAGNRAVLIDFVNQHLLHCANFVAKRVVLMPACLSIKRAARSSRTSSGNAPAISLAFAPSTGE